MIPNNDEPPSDCERPTLSLVSQSHRIVDYDHSTNNRDTNSLLLNPASTPTSPSIFYNASRFTVYDGLFSSAHTSFFGSGYTVYNSGTIQQDPFIELSKRAQIAATTESESASYAARCHPGTRQAVIADILEWATSPSTKSPILWLYGAAGGGKTCIQREVVDNLRTRGVLAGCWFFSTHDRVTKVDPIAATLASQLASVSSDLKSYICREIKENPAIFEKSLQVQFDHLLCRPLLLNALSSNASVRSMIFGKTEKSLRRDLRTWWKTLFTKRPKGFRQVVCVVDNLDECEDPEAQVHLLRIIESIAEQGVPLKFAVSSRPEFDIRTEFSRKGLHDITKIIRLDDYEGDRDIRNYLFDELTNIKRIHPSSYSLPADWPTSRDLDLLVEKSSKQFIYAATVVRFVAPRRPADSTTPVALLQSIIELQPSPSSNNPFADIDALYSAILHPPGINIPTLRNILHVLARYPAAFTKPSEIDALLKLPPGETEVVLTDVHSLVHVPNPSDRIQREHRFVHFYHKSLEDFLAKKSRSGDLYQSANTTRAYVIDHIVDALQQWERDGLSDKTRGLRPAAHVVFAARRSLKLISTFLHSRHAEHVQPSFFFRDSVLQYNVYTVVKVLYLAGDQLMDEYWDYVRWISRAIHEEICWNLHSTEGCIIACRQQRSLLVNPHRISSFFQRRRRLDSPGAWSTQERLNALLDLEELLADIWDEGGKCIRDLLQA